MNRYPLWKNILVCLLLIWGFFYTLPNFYGEVPAVQISSAKATVKLENTLPAELESTLQQAGISHTGVFTDENSVRLRFADTDTQLRARDLIEAQLNPDREDPSYVVALNLLSASPNWLTAIGALPMYLGLDLRGGVHFLLEVDMNGAITKRLDTSASDFRTTLREAGIRHGGVRRVERTIEIRLRDAALADGVKNLAYDPDNTYSVPYLWQTVGIVYDTTKIDPEKVEEKGWEIFRDAEYEGHVYMYDSERDAFMIAFKALGYSANTENEDEIQAAYEWLREMDKAVHPSYVTDEVIDSMANGEKWLALVYSGDAAYILSENDKMGFCNPEQGTNIAVDAMVIPANAGNPELANQFINYILQPDNALAISTEVGYASPLTEVMEELSGPGGDYEGNEAYRPRSGYEKDEMFTDNEVLKKKLSELWIKVKLHE